MATKTWYFGDVLAAATLHMDHRVSDDAGLVALTRARDHMWNQADWRGSIVSLPPFWLIPGEQDHGRPCYSVPADYLGLREVTYVEVLTTTVVRSPVHVKADLPLTDRTGCPVSITHIDRPQITGPVFARRAFRVHPRVPPGYGAGKAMIEGTYKFMPAKVSTLNTVIPWEDCHFSVFVETTRWQLMNPNDLAAYANRQAYVDRLIEQMKEQEGLNMGDHSVHPSEALVHNYNVW